MKIAAAFATGIVLWPALEHGLHRVLAHTVTFKSDDRIAEPYRRDFRLASA